jgi:hypothetical protein
MSSSEYNRVLITIDEIERKLFDVLRFGIDALDEQIDELNDLEQLAWVRNHKLNGLISDMGLLQRSLEEIRARACPVLPELQVFPDGSRRRVWRNQPNKWSEVLPDDVHSYIL